MSLPFLCEIRIVAFDFAPDGMAFCDGQRLQIEQFKNNIFPLLQRRYGGDATTFNLPDLRGRVPVSFGAGPGLTPREQGAAFGEETVTLNADNIPPHTHTFNGSTADGTTASTTGALLATPPARNIYIPSDPTPTQTPVKLVRGSIVSSPQEAHDNRMPYLAVRFCIAMSGVMPRPA